MLVCPFPGSKGCNSIVALKFYCQEGQVDPALSLTGLLHCPGLPLFPRISALLSPGCTASGSPSPTTLPWDPCWDQDAAPLGIWYGTNGSGAALALGTSSIPMKAGTLQLFQG